MNKILIPFWRLYVVVVWFIVGTVLTVLTALICIVMAFMGCFSAKALAVPPRLWSRLLCCLGFVRVKVEGLENLKKGQSYVIASNHQSAFDIWAIYGWLPVTFSFVMKKELRKIPFVGLACERVGHIFIDRSNPVSAKRSLLDAESKLHDGHCIVIFPEGTRSRTGKIGKFKRGAFAIASDLNIPVLPVSISGSFESVDCNGYSINPSVITVTIHPAIVPEGNTEQDMRILAQQTFDVVSSSLPDRYK